MAEIIQIIINGVVLGSNLVMVAVGFSMLIGIMRLIQFAHGEMYMLGGYGVWYFSVQLGLNYWLGLVISVAIVTAFGIFLERYFLRQFRENLLAAVVVTVAWMMILETGALLIFGTESKVIPTVFPGTFSVRGVYLSNERLIVSLVALSSIGMVLLYMSKTKGGMAMRAVAREAETATMMGVNLAKVFRSTMILATVLAAAAGALMGPIFSMDAMVGGSMSFKALVAITLGGMGSVGGTVLACYLLGMIESFTGTLVGADFAMLIYFLILILVLLVRPQGFFGFEYKF